MSSYICITFSPKTKFDKRKVDSLTLWLSHLHIMSRKIELLGREHIKVSVCFPQQPCLGSLVLLLKRECHLDQVGSAIASTLPSSAPCINKKLGETNMCSLGRSINSYLKTVDQVQQKISGWDDFLDKSFLIYIHL